MGNQYTARMDRSAPMICARRCQLNLFMMQGCWIGQALSIGLEAIVHKLLWGRLHCAEPSTGVENQLQVSLGLVAEIGC